MTDNTIKNPNNAEWVAVKKYTAGTIEDLHLQLEGSLSDIETAVIRGQIIFARKLLQLEKKSTKIEIASVNYDH